MVKAVSLLGLTSRDHSFTFVFAFVPHLIRANHVEEGSKFIKRFCWHLREEFMTDLVKNRFLLTKSKTSPESLILKMLNTLCKLGSPRLSFRDLVDEPTNSLLHESECLAFRV